MDTTSITPHLPSRSATDGQRPRVIGASQVSDGVEIFKKTPFVAGLHPVSRDVVKHIAEIHSIPSSTITTLDQDVAAGEAAAVRTLPERSLMLVEPTGSAIAGAQSLLAGDLENNRYADS